MDELDYDSALIVTTDFYTRRSRLAFERVNERGDYHFDLTYIGSGLVKYSEIRTEQTKDGKQQIPFRETVK